MDNYVEVLKYLIELKKTKKEPNRLERDQFTEAWNTLLRNEGYSALAEEYLYKGFTYCGAAPLKNYIKNSEDRITALSTILNGKMYGENCASTVPILFHLLTLFLNEKTADEAIISLLIKRIPAALKNKEGKIYGQADRALKKYILDDLHSEILPPLGGLIDNGLKAIFVKEFVAVFDEIFAGMKSDGFSKKCIKNIKLLQEWMHPVVQESPVRDDIKIKETASAEGDITIGKTEGSEIVPAKKESENTTEITSENVTVAEPSDSNIFESRLEEAKKQIEAINAELEKQKALASSLRQQLADVTSERNRLGEIASVREARLSGLSSELLASKSTIEKLEQRVAQLEMELQERMKMMEALSRDRAKQSDEAIHRLASKLKVEYRDFMDAIDIPMDSDLGENMREQLKNVFNILIKAGITMS